MASPPAPPAMGPTPGILSTPDLAPSMPQASGSVYLTAAARKRTQEGVAAAELLEAEWEAELLDLPAEDS
jgi:hypothetical protein